MSGFKRHLAIDRRYFEGREYPEVHKLLDQFSHYPDRWFLERHRKFLHHKEGIEYIRKRWGDEAAKAAEYHIIEDCKHVPNAIDYYIGKVDEYGLRAVKYNDARRIMFHHEVRLARRSAEGRGETLSVDQVMAAWDILHSEGPEESDIA